MYFVTPNNQSYQVEMGVDLISPSRSKVGWASVPD